MACAELSNHPVFWGIDHDEALIRKGEKERPVQPEYVPYLMELATELFNLNTHRPSALKELIKELGIDKWSRLARQNDFNEEVAEYNKKVSRPEDKKKEKEDKYLEKLNRLYRHNKGIILELLMPCVMYRLDSPVTSRSNNPLLFQTPYTHTQGGHPDVTVDYGDGFILYVEVSVNMLYGDDHLKSQLESALEHMKSDEVYWTLLVTRWDYKTSRQSVEYTKFMEKNQEEMMERSIIFLSIIEMARICSILAYDAKIHTGEKILSGKQTETVLSRCRDAQNEYQIEEEDGEDRDDEAGGDNEAEDEDLENEDEEEDEYKEINLVEIWTDTTKELLYPEKKKRTSKKSAGAAPAS